MIELARGNILEADAEALVNTVNCVGFMGKGIALQFKKAQQGLPESHEGPHDLDVDLDRSIQGHRAGFQPAGEIGVNVWGQCAGWCQKWSAGRPNRKIPAFLGGIRVQ